MRAKQILFYSGLAIGAGLALAYYLSDKSGKETPVPQTHSQIPENKAEQEYARLRQDKTFQAYLQATNKNGETPLILAAKSGNLETLEKLLKGGADATLEHKDKDGRTALQATLLSMDCFTAIGCGKLLLSYGANIDSSDNNGITALLNAAAKKNGEIVEFCLANGANRNAHDNTNAGLSDFYKGNSLIENVVNGFHKGETYLCDAEELEEKGITKEQYFANLRPATYIKRTKSSALSSTQCAIS